MIIIISSSSSRHYYVHYYYVCYYSGQPDGEVSPASAGGVVQVPESAGELPGAHRVV